MVMLYQAQMAPHVQCYYDFDLCQPVAKATGAFAANIIPQLLEVTSVPPHTLLPVLGIILRLSIEVNSLFELTDDLRLVAECRR